MAVSYLRLDPNQIIETVEVLTRRIRERFPGANLNKVCDSLLDVSKQAQVRSNQISRPMYLLRLLTLLLITGIALMFGQLFRQFHLKDSNPSLENILQMVDAGFQTLVVVVPRLSF